MHAIVGLLILLTDHENLDGWFKIKIFGKFVYQYFNKILILDIEQKSTLKIQAHMSNLYSVLLILVSISFLNWLAPSSTHSK